MTAPLFLFAQCTAMVDVNVAVDDAMIAATRFPKGSTTLSDSDAEITDLIAAACRSAGVAEPHSISPGGSGIISARACQWILRGHGAPAPIGVLGTVADDAFGGLMARCLERR